MNNCTLRPSAKPMKRSPMARGTKPMRTRRKHKARGAIDQLCHGQRCFLAIPGVCRGDVSTVVPAHSNQARDGKSMGKKAADQFTVPACFWCHTEIDSGKNLSRAERFAIWDAGYARWAPVRDSMVAA